MLRRVLASLCLVALLAVPAAAQSERRLTILGGQLWTPLNDPGLIAWWDASYTPSLTLNVGNVSAWVDRKAGIVASQGTGANQPGYSVASASDNNKPALLSGGTKFLVATGVPLPTGAASSALYVFGRQTTGSPASGGIFIGTGSSTNTALIERSLSVDGTTGRAVADYGGGNKTTDVILSAISGTPAFYEWTFNGTTASLFVNGSAGTTGAPALNSSGSQVDIFNLPYFASSGAQSLLQAVITTSVSTCTRQKYEGSIGSWYVGLQGANLPSNHPYKSGPPRAGGGC